MVNIKKQPDGNNLQITFPIEDQLKDEEEKKNGNGLQTILAPGFTGVIVDVHEPPVIPISLQKDKGLLVKVMSLKSGDYVFANVGIERKEFGDYMGSLTSGRLWEQMYNLKRSYERPILVIEGLKDPTLQLAGNISIRFVSSISRIVLMGVSVIVLPTLAHFLSFIQYTYLSCGRQGASMKPIPKKPWYREKEEIKEDLLCIPIPEEILLSSGISNLSDIKNRESIFGNTILESFIRKYKGNIITLKGRGLLPIKVSENHLVFSSRRSKRWIGKKWKYQFSDPEWKKAKDLIPYKDCLILEKECRIKPSILQINRARKLSSPKHLNLKDIEIDEDFGWLMGLYLAEGHSSGCSVVWSLNSNEKDLINKLSKILRRYSLELKPLGKKGNSIQVGVLTQQLANTFSNIFGKDCYSKRIPEIIMTSNLSIVSSFIEGYLDGDGTRIIKTPRAKNIFGTSSKAIAIGLQRLLTKLNLWSTIHSRMQSFEYDERIYPAKKFYVITLSLSQKQTGIGKTPMYFIVPLYKKIISKYNGNVWDARTENNEILYNNVIIHNCMCPGIGRKTAKAILARFNTFDALMKASPLEISNTGLGKKRSQALYEILHT